MTNINITATTATFYSSVSTSEIVTELLEPKWVKNDDNCFALSTSQGIFCITITDFSFNTFTYSSVEDALDYLNTL